MDIQETTGRIREKHALINRIRDEMNGDCVAVATGGMVSAIPSLYPDYVEVVPYLTLDGIREIGLRV